MERFGGKIKKNQRTVLSKQDFITYQYGWKSESPDNIDHSLNFEFKHNLSKGLWIHEENPFVLARKLTSIKNQYGCKFKMLYNSWWKYVI
jgi:hypothetical protein